MTALEQQAEHAYDILRPAHGRVRPIVFSAAHAGFDWPDGRSAAAREAMGGTWDAHLDQLLGGVPLAGATLLHARFPRAYIDVDVSEGEAERELRAAEAPDEEVAHRLGTCFHPYRDALRRLISDAYEQSGVCWHFEVRAVPSRGRRGEIDAGQLRPDVVVCDRMGTTASPALTARIIEWFDALGFRVQMNDPFRGGDLIGTFGNPRAGRHSVQLAMNRALFLNERTFERSGGFNGLQHTITTFAHELATWVGDE